MFDEQGHRDTILVIDFGSQYTNVIARRIREMGIYARVLPYWEPLSEIMSHNPQGIILSGGPGFVNQKGSPRIPVELFDSGVPILGICYGLQLMAHLLGGRVEPGKHREFGPAMLALRTAGGLFQSIPRRVTRVWMSHGDQVTKLPKGFRHLADSPTTKNAVVANERKKLYGMQFHPEVAHTQYGQTMLRNFVIGICHARKQWRMSSWIDETLERIRSQVGRARVICALSGGVDSTVAATLAHQAVGKQLQCLYVDTGLMRLGETEQVLKALREGLRLPVRSVHAQSLFLRRLKGITDPEQKRKAIGKTFIDVFDREARALGAIDYLVQGTLYSDVIESALPPGVGRTSPAQTIKSHHNVGGLPTRLRFKLIEPLRELFKDEVRRVGMKLGVPPSIIGRHPFPGPGLAIRMIGAVTPHRVEVLRQADAIMTEEIRRSGWYDRIWQSAAILTGVHSTAVMGDERTYHEVCAIRLVHSSDAMTAHWVRIPYTVLDRISNRIVNEVRGITRVVYDISNKPPATIEWE